MIMDGVDEDVIMVRLNDEANRLALQNDRLITNFITSNFDNVLGAGVFMILTSSYPYPVMTPQIEEIMAKADRWTSPLFAAFFVVSGAELELSVFADKMIVLIGLVYIVTRSLGKYLGAHYSAKLMKCSPAICKYLGITLLPQAGVALGMCVSAQELGAADGLLVRNIVLFSVLIYELVGPLLTKEALTAAGEITAKPKEVLERRAKALAEAEPKEFLEEREAKKHKKQDL